jgi:phosphoglycerol transferase MdoB-like AlkP superfamily enzyme
VKRLRIPDYATGIAGLLLLCGIFAPWYKMADGTVDGWRSTGYIDIWLLITVLLAFAVPLVTAAKDSPALPVAMDVLTWFAALISILLTLFRLINKANDEFVTGRSWGIFLAFAAAIAVFAAAHWAMRTEDAPGLREPPEVRAMPTPPVTDPATPPT